MGRSLDGFAGGTLQVGERVLLMSDARIHVDLGVD